MEGEGEGTEKDGWGRVMKMGGGVKRKTGSITEGGKRVEDSGCVLCNLLPTGIVGRLTCA